MLEILWKTMNEIFLDTETTGLSVNEKHRIIEIACIETNDLTPFPFSFPACRSIKPNLLFLV